MQHVHLSRELWHAISEGRRSPSDLANLACGHLMQLCSTCKAEFEAFRREAREEGRAHSHPVAVERTAVWAEAKMRQIAAERRQAETKLAALLAMGEEERLAAVVQTPEEYQGPALAQALIEECRGQMPGAPNAALALANLATHVLTQTPLSAIVNELFALANAHMANALRASGQLPVASLLFGSARFLLRTEAGGDRMVQAEMDNLEGALQCDQRHFGEAEQLLERSVHGYRGAGLPQLAARSLLDLGTLHQEQGHGGRAAEAAGEVLRLLDPEAEPLLCFIARHNRAHALCIQGQYHEARRLLAANEPHARRHGDPLSTLRVAWVEGKIARGLGEREAAESSLLAARHGFLRHGIAYDAALVSLELALFYLDEGRADEVKQLATEMVQVFEEQKVHREATAALLLFREAAELERASAGLVQKLTRYLTQSRRDPALPFQTVG